MKNIFFITISIIIFTILLSSCAEKNESIKELKVSRDSSKTDSNHVFNVPEILRTDINEIKKMLGRPVTNFKPSEEQKLMHMLPVIEYKNGTTFIFIEYDSLKVNKIFISDNFKERTVEDIMKLGNIELNNPEYLVKVTEWKKRTIDNSDTLSLAGIEVSNK